MGAADQCGGSGGKLGAVVESESVIHRPSHAYSRFQLVTRNDVRITDTWATNGSFNFIKRRVFAGQMNYPGTGNILS